MESLCSSSNNNNNNNSKYLMYILHENIEDQWTQTTIFDSERSALSSIKQIQSGTLEQVLIYHSRFYHCCTYHIQNGTIISFTEFV